MGGIVKGGVVLYSGANVAIQGIVPGGMAGNSAVIWESAPPPAAAWKLLNSATATVSGSNGGQQNITLDTTGANLIVIATCYSGVLNLADALNNSYGHVQATDTLFDEIFYTLNPVTSSTHTFTYGGNNATYSSWIFMVYSAPGVVLLDQSSFINSGGGATALQLPAITPSAANALILTSVGENCSTINSVDSSFAIQDVLQCVGGQSNGSAIASLIQASPAAISPTWTLGAGTYSCGTMVSFVPSPWTLLASTTGVGDAAVGSTITTAPINTTGATLIYVGITFYGGTSSNTLPTFSDSAGNTWVLSTTSYVIGYSVNMVAVCINPITSAAHTFSLSTTIQNFNDIIIGVFSGPPVLIGSGSTYATAASTVSSIPTNPLTPPVSKSLVIATCSSSGQQHSVDSGFMMVASVDFKGGTYYGGAMAYLVQEVAGAVSPTFNLGTSAQYGGSSIMLYFTPISVPTGLTDFWPMNEGAGTTFNNAVNPSNPMTASNIAWATNAGFVNAPSPQFNGSTSGAISAQNSTLDGPFSLCVAVIAANIPSSVAATLLRTSAPSSYTGCFVDIFPGGAVDSRIVSNYPSNLYIELETQSGLITTNTAYYICVTYDGSGKAAGVTIYINGTLQSATINKDTLASSFLSNVPFRAGADESGANQLTGTLANARIYNRVLTAAEVSQLSATMGK